MYVAIKSHQLELSYLIGIRTCKTIYLMPLGLLIFTLELFWLIFTLVYNYDLFIFLVYYYLHYYDNSYNY